ncbi:MAG: hypothetical protein PHR06_12045, partial [Candidatus Cloacimonetes bacterium]|nr:hypothetical protein [Candidatus Cloacimonadota bacterium]
MTKMHKLPGILFLLVILLSNLQANTFSVTAKVCDELLEPIQDVVVTNGTVISTTDKNGRFILKNISTADSISFYRTGFHTLKISPSALSQQVVMKRKSYRLENLTVYGKIETAETFSSNLTVIRNSEFQSKTDFNEIFSRYPEIALKGTMLPGEKKAVT